MKVLWIINAPTPRAASALGIPSSGFPTWIEAAHLAMLARDDVEVSVAFPFSGEPRSTGDVGATFAAFPAIQFGREREGALQIAEMVRGLEPDIVHIFGTEGGHAYAAALACARLSTPFVVGLQGLSSTIAQHYMSGLPPTVSHGFTFRDAIRFDNIAMQAAKYRDRGLTETLTLRLAKFLIGRTSWDRAVSHEINPAAQYFTVPEILRPAFYANRWSQDACQPNSIFMSQGHYPIKGLHFMVRALPAIVAQFPDAQLYVGGLPSRPKGTKGRIAQTRYALYIHRLIRQLEMTDHVRFLGVLDEVEMVRRYLTTHVFVSASTVENESNSLSEAKLLGVPVVASYVGGVVDRIEHGATGFFYQHDAPYMLAHYVTTLFQNPQLCAGFSASARAASLELNDVARNAQLLMDAYHSILRAPESPTH